MTLRLTKMVVTRAPVRTRMQFLQEFEVYSDEPVTQNQDSNASASYMYNGVGYPTIQAPFDNSMPPSDESNDSKLIDLRKFKKCRIISETKMF